MRKIKGIVDLHIPIADVRDVANAHVISMLPSIQGRYCLCHSSISIEEAMEIVRSHFPPSQLPHLPSIKVRYYHSTIYLMWVLMVHCFSLTAMEFCSEANCSPIRT